MITNTFAVDNTQNVQQTDSTKKNDKTSDELSSLTSDGMGKDDFLKLFVEQLKNQDPLNPMEDYEVAAQLAQYSSLEQLVNINKNFDKFLGAMSLNSYFQGLNLLGKNIEYTGDKFEYDPEKDSKVNIKFNLKDSARSVNVNIYDDKDNYVRTLKVENPEKGDNSVEWDGIDKLGNKMTKGVYHYEVVAYDNDGENISYTPYGQGTVDNISFDKDKNEALIKVNGDEINITDIKAVNN